MENGSDDITLLRWEALTKKKFDRLDRAECIVLVTCSPLEVHGPHLPFGADLLEGDGLALHAIRHLPERHRRRTFLQLPFVFAATDTVPQPGSIFFRPSTTIAVLTDLGRSLAAQGFRNVFVSNFHGSPRHFLAIEQACAKVSRERGIHMVSVFSVMVGRLTGGSAELYDVLGGLGGMAPEDYRGDTHGGLVETSQLLALHPEWVERDYATLPRRTVDMWVAEKGMEPPRIERGKPANLGEMIKAFNAGLRYFEEESYTGQPAKASAELGRQILDTLGSRTAEVMTDILEDRLPPDQWHSPLWPKRHLFIHPWLVRFFDWWLGIGKGVR